MCACIFEGRAFPLVPVLVIPADLTRFPRPPAPDGCTLRLLLCRLPGGRTGLEVGDLSLRHNKKQAEMEAAQCFCNDPLLA